MPQRSKVMTLPHEVRQRLDALLIERGFSGYAELAEWLAANGHPISATSLKRHGRQLEERIERLRLASEQAEAFISAAPGDTGALTQASLYLVQERIFELMKAAEGGDLKELAATARALADAARASLAVRQDRRKVLAEAAEAAGEAVQRLGLSDDTDAAIRAAIERTGRGRA